MIYGTEEFAIQLKAIVKDGARHPLYSETVKHATDMSVHVNGDKPIYLLERARPREDSEVKVYRIENYEPTTKSGSDKALDILSKMFNPTLYSIIWKEQTTTTEELRKYLMEEYPDYNSIVNFDKDVLLRKMMADPNGVMAVRPRQIPRTDIEPIEPISVIYSSENVWWYDLDCFLIFMHKSKTEQQEYFHFSYYDNQQFINLRAWWVESDKSIFFEETEPPYTHGAGQIPAWFLRGKSKATGNGTILFESYFSSALPHWNLAVIHESDLLGAYINHMHPQKYEMAEECNHRYQYQGMGYPCRMGAVTFPGGKAGVDITIDCPSCHGSGYNAVKSPYGVYQFNKKKLEDSGSTQLVPVGYISIPVDATKMLEERTREMNKKAMWAINMDVEDKVGENQSGVAKVIDRSAQSDFIFTISSTVFDLHLNNQVFFINIYKNGAAAKDQNLPDVNKPMMFDILTTAELLNNFVIAQKGGIDKNYLRIKAIEIVNRDLNSAPELKNYLITIIDIDPLYGFTQDEISLGVTSGVIRQVDWAIHENIKPFTDRALQEKKDFLNLDRIQKLEVYEQYGEELIKASKPAVDPNLLVIDKNIAA